MKNAFIIFLCLMFTLQSCFKDPYEPQPYHAKAVVIGEEKCSVDSNYNYWLLDLSMENNSREQGDTITYKGVVYNHAFKAINLADSLRVPNKQIEIDFNFSGNDPIRVQSSNCDAVDAETFLLIDIGLFNQVEIK